MKPNPAVRSSFRSAVKKVISSNILGRKLRNTQEQVIKIMDEINLLYERIRLIKGDIAQKIFDDILSHENTKKVIEDLSKFLNDPDYTTKNFKLIVEKLKDPSGYESFFKKLNITSTCSDKDLVGLDIQRLIRSLNYKLQIVLISLKNKYHAGLIASVYDYKDLRKANYHQESSTPQGSKKYFILNSKDDSNYIHEEDKDNLEEKTKIAFSSPPNPSPPARSNSNSKPYRNQYLNANKVSDKDLGVEIALTTGDRVSNIMKNLIEPPSATNSPKEKLKKLKYFLMAIKLQGINKKETEFNSLSDSADPSNSLNYKEAKNFSKLFQRASKEKGLLTGRVDEYRKIKESKIVGMRTKRIPLILVVELARKMLSKEEFDGFMVFQKKIFEIPTKAPATESSTTLKGGDVAGLGPS
jgi:hypothetical protein